MEHQKKLDNLRVDVLYANGSRRRVVIPSSAITLVKQAAIFRPYLFQGTGFNPLDADAANIVAVAKADHDILHGCGPERQQAAFRLWQMDMQASIADMLEDLADGTQGEVCATLIDAAQRVRDLQLCAKAEGGAKG